MKTLFLIPLILVSVLLNAQKQQLDTIYANDSKNVALFFPNPIKQAITGSENFVFTYNREKEQYFGLLQAAPGIESNLLAITSDGKVYSYILKYDDRIKTLNRFIRKQESIGEEKPVVKNITNAPVNEDNYKNRMTFFEKFSRFLLERDLKTIASKNERGINLMLKEIVYQHTETYLVMEIKNKSDIDFEVNYLDVSISNSNKKRKSSYQGLTKKPVFKYNFQSIIKSSETKHFVYIMPKFVLGDNEKLEVRLKEFRGNRYLKLNTRIN